MKLSLAPSLVALCAFLLATDAAYAAPGSAGIDTSGYHVPKNKARSSFSVRAGPYAPWWSDNTAEREYTRSWVYGTGAERGNPWQEDAESWAPMLLQAEYAFTLMEFYGPISVHGAMGYWRASGRTHYCEDSATGAPLSCEPGAGAAAGVDVQVGNGENTLTMIPIQVGAGYRFDLLRTRYGLPLMFVTKAGLNLTYYRASDKNGTLERIQGDETLPLSGFRQGFYGTFGVLLNLDWLDRTTGISPTALGLVATHISLEATWLASSPLGTYKDKGDIRDHGSLGLVQVGLAFDFKD